MDVGRRWQTRQTDKVSFRGNAHALVPLKGGHAQMGRIVEAKRRWIRPRGRLGFGAIQSITNRRLGLPRRAKSYNDCIFKEMRSHRCSPGSDPNRIDDPVLIPSPEAAQLVDKI